MSEQPKQREFVERMLNGSQAKTAFALRLNCEDMIAGNSPRTLKEVQLDEWTGQGGETKPGKKILVWKADAPENLHCTGFLTLTVGDYHCEWHAKQMPDGKDRCPVCGWRMSFRQIWDVEEASRRLNNLNRRVLPELFSKSILVTERHANKAIHFHAVGILTGHPDIRTGLDFKAVAKGDYASASPALLALWAKLRDVLPNYGFGRHELLPIKHTGEAVACYVSKYIEKNVCNRLHEDKGKKLVRYLGWKNGERKGSQLKPNEFGWASLRAAAWREKATQICLAARVPLTTTEQREKEFQPKFLVRAWGPRWAFQLTRAMRDFVFLHDDGTIAPEIRAVLMDCNREVSEKKRAEGKPIRSIWEARPFDLWPSEKTPEPTWDDHLWRIGRKVETISAEEALAVVENRTLKPALPISRTGCPEPWQMPWVPYWKRKTSTAEPCLN